MPYKNIEAARLAKREWARKHRASLKAKGSSVEPAHGSMDADPVDPWSVRAEIRNGTAYVVVGCPLEEGTKGPRLSLCLPLPVARAVGQAAGRSSS